MKLKKIKSLVLVVSSALSMPAAVIYTNLNSLVIPFDENGLYVNIVTGQTGVAYPSDFNTAPWINLTYGGTVVFNSDLLRPWASQAPGDYDASLVENYFINLAPGTVVDGSGTFVSGENYSDRHVGLAGAQFQVGQKGYLAFAYEASVGAGTSYGWLSFAPNTNGGGYSFDFAYSDTLGEALVVGVIPEPAAVAALAGVIGLGAVGLRRRRRSA